MAVRCLNIRQDSLRFSAILCDSLRFSGGCSMLDLEDSHLLENEIFIVNTTEREKEREKKRERKREK